MGQTSSLQRMALEHTSSPEQPGSWLGGGNQTLDVALHVFEVAAFNFAYRFIGDARVHQDYIRQIKVVSKRIKYDVSAGKLSAAQGAQEAHVVRNKILTAARTKTSDIGLAVAQAHKQVGRSFESLLEQYSGRQFNTTFDRLTAPQRNQVYLELVESAGRNSPTHSKAAFRNLTYGRALLAVSLSIAALNIITAEDKVSAAVKEGTVLAGGALGGMAAGAASGLLCGPGAPVCVTVLVFVGGVLGALGADYTHEWLTE